MAPSNDDDREKITAFLRRGAWFAGLPAALQEGIVRRSTLRSYERGAVISTEGVVPEGLFALLEGRVEFFRHVGSDDEILVHVGEPGFWFGEIGVLGADGAAVSALAQTAVRALLLPRIEFERIVEEDPRSYRPLARLAIDRYVTALGFLAQVGGLSPETRLRHRLADLAELRRLEGDVEGDVVLAVSQDSLARLLGVSRQTLNRLVKKLESERLVEAGFRRIRVRDPDRLRGAGGRSPAGRSTAGPGPLRSPGPLPTRHGRSRTRRGP